jgi:hypothetical protein
MRFLKITGMCSVAVARENSLGIHEVTHVTFTEPTRVGSAILPAGDYVMRHTMEGQDHIMVFERSRSKTPIVKVKCTLVPLAHPANHSQTVVVLNAANERVLQEIVVRGDKAKHVF